MTMSLIARGVVLKELQQNFVMSFLTYSVLLTVALEGILKRNEGLQCCKRTGATGYIDVRDETFEGVQSAAFPGNGGPDGCQLYNSCVSALPPGAKPNMRTSSKAS